MEISVRDLLLGGKKNDSPVDEFKHMSAHDYITDEKLIEPHDFNSRQYKIGDWVEFQKECYGLTRDNMRCIYRKSMPNKYRGQIVGIKRLLSGDVDSEYDYESAYWSRWFSADKTYTFWSVKTSLTGKEHHVHPDDVVKIEVDEKDKLPVAMTINEEFKHSEGYKAYIEDLREEMKNWPRDEKGRWKKLEPIRV